MADLYLCVLFHSETWESCSEDEDDDDDGSWVDVSHSSDEGENVRRSKCDN